MNNEFSLGLPEIGHHLGFVHVYGQRSKGFQALLHGIATAKTKHVSMSGFTYLNTVYSAVLVLFTNIFLPDTARGS
jgi:hypothetical protein